MSGQRNALIIANARYDHHALRDLGAPVVDAEALSRVLADQQIGEFAVQVVSNETSHVIASQIEDLFFESRPDDLLLVYFSGHGLKSESGELFFAASNTRPDRLGSTAVAADFLQRCIRGCRSRSIVLLLDCCYSGAFAKGMQVRAAGDINVLDSFPRERMGGGRGWAVITASSATEFAFEKAQPGEDVKHTPSVFTSALVEGLVTGDADRDGDGWVSLDELYDYVYDKVREQNPNQTPSRRIELEGELYLARSLRGAALALIPADLRAALAATNMYARQGAMNELRSRLVSDDLPTALAAHAALTELARTGSRHLASPAAEALREVALRPNQVELHFGTIEQGSAPPHQVIRLLGPPIARACTLSPSAPWIRASRHDESVTVSVDTAYAGTLQGSLVLRGQVGEVIVAVDVDLRRHPRLNASQDESPSARMCMACSADSAERVLAGEDGYCPSCGRRVSGWQRHESDRDHVEFDIGQVAGVSDRGLEPLRNEDAMDFAVVDLAGGPVVVGIVADGVASAPRAAEASQIAVEAAITLLAEGVNRGDDLVRVSQAAIKHAGRVVTDLVGPDGVPATTYMSAVVGQRAITVCWLGSSRAYWLADEQKVSTKAHRIYELSDGPRLLTRDDTDAAKPLASVARKRATDSLLRDGTTRWLGGDLPDPQPHIEQFTPIGPGVLLLCSDGLWNYCPEANRLAAMALPVAHRRPLDAATALARYAIDRGGRDNVTVVLIPFPPRANLAS